MGPPISPFQVELLNQILDLWWDCLILSFFFPPRKSSGNPWFNFMRIGEEMKLCNRLPHHGILFVSFTWMPQISVISTDSKQISNVHSFVDLMQPITKATLFKFLNISNPGRARTSWAKSPVTYVRISVLPSLGKEQERGRSLSKGSFQTTQRYFNIHSLFKENRRMRSPCSLCLCLCIPL
jgi:hypothetical protein